MSTVVLDGPLRTVEIASSGRRCDAVLDVFESEDSVARAHAVQMCADCPLLQGCQQQTRSEILDDRGPIGVVRAGIAWDDDGVPDTQIHSAGTTPAWVPAITTAATPLVDEYVVELAFSDPARIRDLLVTPEETDAIIREAAERGESLNTIHKILGIRWSAADAAARRLGIRDRFATKKPKHAADSTEAVADTTDIIIEDKQAVVAEAPAATVETEANVQLAFDFPEYDTTTSPTAPSSARDPQLVALAEAKQHAAELISPQLSTQARGRRPECSSRLRPRRRTKSRLGPVSSFIAGCGTQQLAAFLSPPTLFDQSPGRKLVPETRARHHTGFRSPPPPVSTSGPASGTAQLQFLYLLEQTISCPWTRDGP